ncbi:sigma-54 interaction domain-containing protein [candidate division KSB1 bacterium]
MNESQRTNTILDSIADGVFTVDADWKVTSFNRAAEEITGIPREEAVGRPCCEVFRASICESDCSLRQTMDDGKPVVNRAVYIVNAEGRRIPISISTALLRADNGEVIGGVETFRDLTLVAELRRRMIKEYTTADITSKSHRLREIIDILPTIAESDSTVLIRGESGTGKELFARAIHRLSSRKDEPLVTVNCGALPDNLLESELFGYKAGAFTDARQDKPGRFAMAEKGTIFLDEIGDVSPALQVRLLRVLQEKEYDPLGSTRPVKANVRVLAATNKDLEVMAADGRFRQDLYYRINVVKIEIPPLRDRKEDIPLLTELFLDNFAALRQKDLTGIAPETMAFLMNHDYPGNVRELENILEHASIMCPGGMILPQHLPGGFTGPLPPESTETSIKDLETGLIRAALKRHNWNRSAAARELGIHKTTLWRKLKRLNIELPSVDGRRRHK